MSRASRERETGRKRPDPAGTGSAVASARARAALLVLGIVAATLVAYIPAMRCGYIWDDDSYVHNNVLIQRGWDALPKIWSPVPLSTPQYYPLVFTTFWLEHKLWGLAPAGFHVVNILLHAANALLVWRVAKRLGVPGAAFVGAVFALHPVHVESVAWVTERKNVLSGLFYLLAVTAYLRFDTSGRWRHYIACGGLFVAALLSKSVTASLPAALVLILFYQRRLGWKDGLRLAPLFVIGIVSGLWTAALEREHVGALGPEWSYGFVSRVTVVAPTSFLFYAQKVLCPHPLMFVYPRWDPHATDWTAYVPLVVVAAAFCGALALVRRIGWAPILLLCFSAGTLFPALGFLNVFPHRYSFVADHFGYLGSLGFIILYTAAGMYVLRWFSRRTARSTGQPGIVAGAPVGVLLLAVCAVLTWRQCLDYKDVITLWERTLVRNPDAWIAMINLGEQYRLAGRIEEARALYERASRYPIARSAALGSLGLIASMKGEHQAAVRYLRDAAAALPPDHPELWFVLARLGWVLKEAGNTDEAIMMLRRAIDLAPQRVDPHYYLADVYLARGDLSNAADAACQAADLDSWNADCDGFAAGILMQLGRPVEALRRYREAIYADSSYLPGYSGAASAALRTGDCAAALETIERGRRLFGDDPTLLYQLVWVWSACPSAASRNGAEAVRLALRLTEQVGVNADTRDALAAAYAETGDFERAVYFATDAIAAARQTAVDAALIAEIEARLRLYKEKRPYRAAAE